MDPVGLVKTIKERCRVCYTCVRECPAKAIRIADGQAEVIAERCIGCGNCVRVCSQSAKSVLDTTDQVLALLGGRDKVVACVAPSFPAEFTECRWDVAVGMIRALGFDLVCEVGFGADLVARRYRQLLENPAGRRYIATSCPAMVTYVERYFPDLTDRLAPIVSPMVAMARALRQIHGGALRVVFVGPCIAKKGEARDPHVAGDVDAVITFRELRKLLELKGITPASVAPGDFDAPRAGTGGLFAISRGLLQAAGIGEDLVAGQVVSADGRTGFIEAVREFQSGDLDAGLLEVLCCNGCIMGAGMSTDTPLFRRRSRVSEYVRQRVSAAGEGATALESFDGLDLSRRYSPDDLHVGTPFEAEIRQIMARMGKRAPEDELNCGACGYDTCHDHAVAIFKGLAESEMCLPYTIEQLRRTVGELADSNEKLADTREALMQSEKLASMGQLAAGIAHEVNNPLGVVLMYAHLLLAEHERDPRLHEDLTMIAEQADRCKRIVAGLLHFARQNRLAIQEVDLPALVARAAKSLIVPPRVRVVLEDRMVEPAVEVDPDQILQVLTNLISNALAAMEDKGGTLTLRTLEHDAQVQVVVADTGVGIPAANLPRVFEPFFTTKQIGKGTGLGLAVTYGIVKMHRGDIRVESNADPAVGETGTAFTVTLPRWAQRE
ncbi:MAG: ATP-binding protein [Planctomycetota bacterium]|nr:ATP-binding protein [Planctomycetota bacterium]